MEPYEGLSSSGKWNTYQTRRLPGYKVEVELLGDWMRTRALINGLSSAVKAGTRAGQRSAANKLLRVIKRNIRENGGSIGWPPLSARYEKSKLSRGGRSNNLLVMTGLYYRSIHTWNRGNNYYVGVKKRLKHPGSKGRLTVAQIATVLEHGSESQKIPARPLWRPSFKQLGGTKTIKGLILWHVREEIYRRYKVRPKINFV